MSSPLRQNETDSPAEPGRPRWKRLLVIAIYTAITLAAVGLGLWRFLKWRAAKEEQPAIASLTISYSFKDELSFFSARLAEIDAALAMHRYTASRKALEELLDKVTSPEMKQLVKERLYEAVTLEKLLALFGKRLNESKDTPPTYMRSSGPMMELTGIHEEYLIYIDLERRQKRSQTVDWHKLKGREMFEIFQLFELLDQLPLTATLFCAVNGLKEEGRAYAAEAWQLFPEERDKLAAWFSWLTLGAEYRAGRVRGFRGSDLIAWEGKLITTEEERALAAAADEADRLRAEADRKRREEDERQRLEEERRRREAEQDAAAREREKLADEAEEREFPLTMSELDRFVKVFRYKIALAGLRDYKARLRLEKNRQIVSQRIAEVEKFFELFERLKNAVNGGELADAVVRCGKEMESAGMIVSATDDEFEIKLLPQGQLKMRWEYLKPKQVCEFYQRLSLTTDDLILLGFFCFELDLVDEAHASLIKALKRRPQEKEFIDKWVARQMGIALPAEGFVAYKGRLVTPIEKANRENGLVLYEGEWVTPEDRDMLAQGYKKFEGKWWARDEAELIAKGFRKHKDRWYSKDEYFKLRQTWDEAWEWDTTHWRIRTNTTEEIAKELGELLEQAYVEYGKFHGKSPREDVKMKMYIFKGFEDYREFCTKNNCEQFIVAGGFSNSSQNYCCGYMRGGLSVQSCLSVVLHEAAHLFHDRTFFVATPSWYAEGVATYFEGGKWYGSQYVHDPISYSRLFFLKNAFSKNTHKPLADVVGGSTFSSLAVSANDTALFYSESWALYYFLNHTTSEDIRTKFKDFKTKLYDRSFTQAYEGEACLTAFKGIFGEDLAPFEQEWKTFIEGVGK